jgi:DNA primase
MFSKEILEEVKAKADIVQFLEKRGVPLRVSGANFVGLCPFHSERSPSFNVRPSSQRYHCFGCQENGDIFDLVIKMEQLSFSGAVQYIADEVGIQVVNDEDDEQYRQLKRLYDITKTASDYFHESFLAVEATHPAKQNLADRKLLDFAKTDPSIGFAPPSGLLKLLHSRRFSNEEIIEAGLATTNENGEVREKFKNRIMWTIYDISGKPVGFSGRRIFDDNDRIPKYLNSPQTRLYNKSRALLGLNFARKAIVEQRAVFIVEGQTDVMALQAAGIQNVVASCGTSFGKQHAEILERLAATSTKKKDQFKFYFMFDPDSAGVKAAKSIFNNIPDIQLLSNVINLSLTTDEGVLNLDPCDLRLKYGDQVLLDTLKDPISMVEFILKQELNDWDVLTPEGRSGFVNATLPTLAVIQDKLAHDAYLRKISYWSGVQYSQLVDIVRGPSNKSHNVSSNASGVNQAPPTIDEQVFAAFLQYPDQMTKLYASRRMSSELFADPEQASHIISELPADNPLMFLDLKIPAGSEDVMLSRLLDKFMKLKYMEALDQLNAQIADNSDYGSEQTDEDMLFKMIEDQQNLKVKYQQV